jgi:hypothetical protein
MLMGIFGQAVFGLHEVHVTQTVLSVGQQWVANSMQFWPQDEHQTMYAISLLKHVVVVLSNLRSSRSGWHLAV